ncbi:metal-dependent transcriptional regulator [Alloscardovia venturai]|uniref:Manganese transport regulator n=1 Tax=Alloscardovia venturai TaxID=1769421 RepID=A0ABW2Y333_9BIFI
MTASRLTLDLQGDSLHLSASAQDYVKAIWKLHEWHHAPETPSSPCVISTSDLARETGMRTSTVSGAISRLADVGLVTHAPYGGIQLTTEGEIQAIRMLRRHRIIETYLVRELGYNWDEVHEEAESLEHAASNFMINRMEERLGFPDRDPHGDPIPDRAGTIPQFDTINLNLVPVGQSVMLARVNDDDTALLQLLQSHDAMVDSIITVVSLCADTITVTTSSGTFNLSRAQADFVRVSRIA